MLRPAFLRDGCHCQNFCAILVAFGAVTLLYFSYDPSPAGANPAEAVAGLDRMSDNLDANAAIEAAPRSNAAADDGELRGKMALLMQVLLLEKGLQKLDDIPHYSATFHKRERIGGVIGEDQFMSLKQRHEPFSIYMKWLKGADEGQEILYVEGENDNEMVVKVGGVSGRMLPSIKLDPNGSMAMSKARYPVMTLGFIPMIEKILEFRHRDLKQVDGVDCRMMEGQKFDQRECFCFIMEYTTPEVSPQFRKSVIYVDAELTVPICIKNYAWPEGEAETDPERLDESTLVEFYSFSNIKFDSELAAIDFDQSNERYQFRR